MTSSEQTGTASTSAGLFIENTIIVQYDPQVQEIWDQARRLRCTWWDFYEKQISFRPFNVDMLDAVTANFLGDNIQCWMQVCVISALQLSFCLLIKVHTFFYSRFKLAKVHGQAKWPAS